MLPRPFFVLFLRESGVCRPQLFVKGGRSEALWFAARSPPLISSRLTSLMNIDRARGTCGVSCFSTLSRSLSLARYLSVAKNVIIHLPLAHLLSLVLTLLSTYAEMMHRNGCKRLFYHRPPLFSSTGQHTRINVFHRYATPKAAVLFALISSLLVSTRTISLDTSYFFVI